MALISIDVMWFEDPSCLAVLIRGDVFSEDRGSLVGSIPGLMEILTITKAVQFSLSKYFKKTISVITKQHYNILDIFTPHSK